MYEEEIHFGKILLKQSEMVLTHLTPVTLTFDPVIYRVHMLPKMYVWTKFEKGRLRRSRVIDRKRKGYRWTERRTDRPTCAKAISSNPHIKDTKIKTLIEFKMKRYTSLKKRYKK